jgi:hypothetical protein
MGQNISEWNCFIAKFSSGHRPSEGQVRLEKAPKTAEVYLDGAYAGTAGELKNMWLDSGAYDIEVRASVGATFRRRVYVLSGKTLKLRSELEVKP